MVANLELLGPMVLLQYELELRFIKFRLLLESIFIDQATLNGTRPNSPSGVKPARPLA